MSPKTLYIVTATCPNEAVLAEFLAWLQGGHVQQVVDLGRAASAWITRLEGPEPRLEMIYVFRSREDLTAYERDHAPALREEGLAKWGRPHGVRFERRTSAILGRCEGRPSAG